MPRRNNNPTMKKTLEHTEEMEGTLQGEAASWLEKWLSDYKEMIRQNYSKELPHYLRKAFNQHAANEEFLNKFLHIAKILETIQPYGNDERFKVFLHVAVGYVMDGSISDDKLKAVENEFVSYGFETALTQVNVDTMKQGREHKFGKMMEFAEEGTHRASSCREQMFKLLIHPVSSNDIISFVDKITVQEGDVQCVSMGIRGGGPGRRSLQAIDVPASTPTPDALDSDSTLFAVGVPIVGVVGALAILLKKVLRYRSQQTKQRRG